jgi:hypothetical protein
MMLRGVHVLLLLLTCAVIGCGKDAAPVTPAESKKVTPSAIRQQVMDLYTGSQPPGKDAWPLIDQALKRLATVHEALVEQGASEVDSFGEADIEYRRIISPEAGDSEAPALELAALARLEEEGIFELLDEIAACPRAIVPLPHNQALLNWDTSHLRSAQQLALAAAASAKLALDAGDEPVFVQRFEQALALGRLASHQPSAMGWLTGAACTSLALRQARSALPEHDLSPASCARVLTIIERNRPAPIAHALRAERLILLDVIARTYTLDLEGDGRLDMQNLQSLGLGPGPIGPPQGAGGGSSPAPPGVADREEMIATVDAYFLPVIEAAQQPRYERADLTDHEESVTDSLTWRHTFLPTILPSLVLPLGQSDVLAMEIAGTQTMLALEVYRGEQGAYPATLASLAPDILGELPLDPYGGRPMGYRLLERDPYGRGYLLYSVGADGVDNGGKYPAEQPWRALRYTPGEAWDYVLNLPPEATERE